MEGASMKQQAPKAAILDPAPARPRAPAGAVPAAEEAETPARRAWREQRCAIEAGAWRCTIAGPRRHAPLPEAVKAALRLGLKGLGLWRRGRANALDIRFRTLTLELANLPAAFEGYRILQISDPHFDAARGLPEAITRAVAGAEADLCVLTGDFRSADGGAFTDPAILAPIAKITRTVRAPDGVLAVLGNHDAADMVPHLERMGVKLLLNESRRLARGGDAILITGVDDVHGFYTPAALAALARHPAAGTLRILLAHSPELAGEAAQAGYDLYLCGHCHGGQICLPGGYAIVRHLLCHRDLYAGLWRYRGLTGYTSTGAGVCGLPVRYNCRGEVTLFVLRRGAAGGTAQTPLSS